MVCQSPVHNCRLEARAASLILCTPPPANIQSLQNISLPLKSTHILDQNRQILGLGFFVSQAFCWKEGGDLPSSLGKKSGVFGMQLQKRLQEPGENAEIK